MTTLRCDQVLRLLMPWLDSELDAATALQVGEHLERCPRCAERFDAETRVDRVLVDALGGAPMPDDVRARLAARLDAEAGRAGRTPRRPSLLRLARWSLAAAALLAALFAAQALLLQERSAVVRRGVLVDAAAAWRAVQTEPPAITSPDEVRALLALHGFADVPLPVTGDASGHTVRLLGARAELLAGAPGVQVSYRCCDVPSSVFLVRQADLDVLPEADRPPPVGAGAVAARVGALRAVSLSEGGTWIGVVGEEHLALADFWAD